MAVFPVIVKGQREAAKLNNVLPEMTKLTARMNEAKQSGNKFDCKNVALLSPLHLSFQPQFRCLCVCACLELLFVCCYSCQSLLWTELVPEEAWRKSSPWLPSSFGAGQFISLYCILCYGVLGHHNLIISLTFPIRQKHSMYLVYWKQEVLETLAFCGDKTELYKISLTLKTLSGADEKNQFYITLPYPFPTITL